MWRSWDRRNSVADGKGDEAERHVVKQAQRFHVAVRREAQTLYAELAQAVRADQNTRNQVARHSRQLERLDEAGNQQTGAERDRNAEQRFHNDYLTFSFVPMHYYITDPRAKTGKKAPDFCGFFCFFFYILFSKTPPATGGNDFKRSLKRKILSFHSSILKPKGLPP